LTGSLSANRLISGDPAVRSRVESAFRNYRVDALRKSADILENKKGGSESLEKII
jgi:hypothetical protein